MNNPCKECLIHPMCRKECDLFEKYISDALTKFGVCVPSPFETSRIIREVTVGYERMLRVNPDKRILWLECTVLEDPLESIRIEITFDKYETIKIRNRPD